VDVEKLTDVRPPEWRIRVGRWRALMDQPAPGVIRVLRVLGRKARIADEAQAKTSRLIRATIRQMDAR